MPRKPHFVLAARRWGWPLSPSYGRVGGLIDKRHGMEAEGRNRLLRVRFTTARPRSARDAPNICPELLPVPVAEDRPDVL